MEILVIDDQVTPRQSWFRRRLVGLGSIASALTSAAAYDLLRARKFDVAFFDHDLGEEDSGSTIATRILMEPHIYHCPRAVWVHSVNPVGAENIASKFRSQNVPTVVSDFGIMRSTPIHLLWNRINDLVTLGE
jgi:hypothetical protein